MENIEDYNDAQQYMIVALGRATPSSDFANSTLSIKYLFHIVAPL
jgi:hypothetical protein